MTKFYQTLNQTPRSMKNHGKHRRAGTPAHSHPVDGAGDGAGGPDAGLTESTILASFAALPAFPGWLAFPPKPEPPTVPYAGIRTGEIIGYRLWWTFRVNDRARISSLTRLLVWEPGETMKGDINEMVAFGARDIYGGVYAYAKFCHAYMEGTMMGADCATGWAPCPIALSCVDDLCIVLGTVKMWGDVVEHETGYRAQYAKVVSFDAVFVDDPKGKSILEELRERHKV